MKKLSVFFFILLTAVLLCACGKSAETPAPEPEPVEVQTAEPEQPAEPETPAEISLAGGSYPADRESLILTGAVDAEELATVLPGFESLKYLDLRDTDLSSEEALTLSGKLEGVRVVWYNVLFGRNYPSDLTELDLSGIGMENSEEVEAALHLFPKLEKVNMSDCGISNEDMDALNKRYDDIRFVWTVHFSRYSLRTDAVYFCASDVPGGVAPTLYSSELEPIRYCTDLEALDLGHMNYTDIDFLSDMTKMKYLILVQGHFSDLSPIANMPDLEFLELFNNNLITDATPLLECKNLKHLNLGYCAFLDIEPLKEMTWLERLWLPHVMQAVKQKKDLQAALPDTEIHCPLTDNQGSTGHGWREDQSYYDMRDAMHMYYLPGGTGMQ